MPTIAGEELNRRPSLCRGRDSQRSFHVVAAPPQAAPTQAVTKTPAMATTKQYTEATVGDTFQGGIASSTTPASAQEIQVACIAAVVQPRV